ncbi:nitroreductase family protein [candidate division KSB1 bacterium]|nr:nitroreductase family protein [candidate division KSB1 bacterium]
MQSRTSVRRFQDKPVEREKLMHCLEAARLAPSAENVQPWRFGFVDDPIVKTKLVKHAFSGIYRATRWAEQAPVLVVICARLDVVANRLGKQMTGIDYYLIDIGIAGEHFVLQAQELGLGTCWIGWFSAKGVKKALHVPKSYRPIALLAVGYPRQNSVRQRKRKVIKNIHFYNEYGQ